MKRVIAAGVFAALAHASVGHAQPSIIPKDLTQRPFQFADIPKVTGGPITPGSILVSGSLRYGYTATLHAPFWVKNRFGKFEFPSGYEFYGVPFQSAFSTGLHGITYCSPRTLGSKSWAGCILIFEKKPVTAISTTYNAYLIDGVAAVFDVAESSSLELHHEPNALAQDLRVAVRVVRWSGKRVDLVTEVLKEGTVVSSIPTKVGLNKGTAIAVFGTGVVKLRSEGDGGVAEAVVPLEAGDSVLPRGVR
jgi:hypothetical protein